jgi:hypothetical protein
MQNIQGLNIFHTHHSLDMGVGVGISVDVGMLLKRHCCSTAAVELPLLQ